MNATFTRWTTTPGVALSDGIVRCTPPHSWDGNASCYQCPFAQLGTPLDDTRESGHQQENLLSEQARSDTTTNKPFTNNMECRHLTRSTKDPFRARIFFKHQEHFDTVRKFSACRGLCHSTEDGIPGDSNENEKKVCTTDLHISELSGKPRFSKTKPTDFPLLNISDSQSALCLWGWCLLSRVCLQKKSCWEQNDGFSVFKARTSLWLRCLKATQDNSNLLPSQNKNVSAWKPKGTKTTGLCIT